MKLSNPKNKFYSYLIILLSIFILIFFTKNIYSSMQVSLNTKDIYNNKIIEKNKILKKLNQIKNDIKSNNNSIKKEIGKFLISFNERDLLEYFYRYVEDNYITNKMKIKSISFTEGGLNDLGFNEGNVNISMYFGNEKAMIKFINFVIDNNSKYTFFLDDFSYPYFGDDTKKDKEINMTFNLKIYYK